MTCSAVFFVPFPKYPKNDGNDKRLSRLFLEFTFVLATQTNSKSGEDVSQIIEPEWFVETSAVKTYISVGKDHKLVCVGKYPICIKCPPFLTFVLRPTKQVNYKVSSTAKKWYIFVIDEQFDWNRKISLAITQEDINVLLTKTTTARSSQDAVMTSHCS